MAKADNSCRDCGGTLVGFDRDKEDTSKPGSRCRCGRWLPFPGFTVMARVPKSGIEPRRLLCQKCKTPVLVSDFVDPSQPVFCESCGEVKLESRRPHYGLNPAQPLIAPVTGMAYAVVFGINATIYELSVDYGLACAVRRRLIEVSAANPEFYGLPQFIVVVPVTVVIARPSLDAAYARAKS